MNEGQFSQAHDQFFSGLLGISATTRSKKREFNNSTTQQITSAHIHNSTSSIESVSVASVLS